jgi:translation initiation factor IF-3
VFVINKYEAASFNQKPVKKNNDLVDYDIRFPEVLVIGPNGEQLGVKPRNEAIKLAEANSLNLVCVAPNAKPPVCKILNYGKFRYEKEKKAKEAKKNQKIVELKEVRFTPRTDLHDLETKAKATKKWLEEGAKVKVTVRFKGREMAHPEIGEETLNQFLGLVNEFATIDKPIQMEGYRMFAVIVPIKKK